MVRVVVLMFAVFGGAWHFAEASVSSVIELGTLVKINEDGEKKNPKPNHESELSGDRLIEVESESSKDSDGKGKPNVFIGLFRENFERLAGEYGFAPVIWDDRVSLCVWKQVQSYVIPKEDGREILSYYAQTLDFHLVFNEVDTSVKLVYVGPKARVSSCES